MYNPLQTVSDDIERQRRDICNACEHKEVRFEIVDTCAQCGCALAMKLKFAAQKCPIDKWGQEV